MNAIATSIPPSPACRLAVCIPTYNRGVYIEHTIRSIVEQLPAAGVEIVVVDNHSTDETEAIVARLMREIPCLRYFRRELNVGADRNVIEAGEFSDSDYFWIFGSDDSMPPGALAAVLAAIESGRYNLILGDAYDCDLELRQTGMLKFLACPAREFDFASLADVEAFLDATTMTASLFGFISSMVFKRSAWETRPRMLHTIGTAYPQVFRSLDLVFRSGAPFCYLAQPIANNRRNNCSYTAEFGEMQRYLIDFRMFRMVIDEYFSQNLHIRNRFKRFVRQCFGRMAHERIRTGIAVMDRLLEFFESDDSAMPAIEPWVRHPLVERAWRRFQDDGTYARAFAGRASLHIGYRHDGEAIVKPIDEGAIGIESGYSGYDGVRLPFESAGKDAIFLSDKFPARADLAAAAAQWTRVLKPEGYMVVTQTLGGEGSASSLSHLLADLEQTLPGFLVCSCRHAEQGSVADIVLQKPPTGIEQLLDAAEQAQREGRLAEAEAGAARALAREPRNTRALQVLGLTAYQAGRHGDAVLRFTAALAIDPALPNASLNLGCAYAALGGIEEAKQCFALALALQPGFAPAAQNLALLQGGQDGGRAQFEQLLQVHPLLGAARQALFAGFGA